jgi:hypothetical protein
MVLPDSSQWGVHWEMTREQREGRARPRLPVRWPPRARLQRGAHHRARRRAQHDDLVHGPRSHSESSVRGVLRVGADEEEWEPFVDLGQSAEDYLNSLAPDDHRFGFKEGDFMYMPAEWWGEER